MSILLDHCVPRKFVRIISEWEYPVTTITQHIPHDSTDGDVIGLAQQLDAVLLTVDLDFAHIHDYPPNEYNGIIVMRYEIAHEAKIILSLKQVLHDLYRDQLRGSLVIVESNRYRIRR